MLFRSLIEQRIDSGIRTNRMSGGVLRVVDQTGAPLPGVEVRVVQTRHEFRFGANIFMLGGFPSAEENSRYEQMYLSLFNYATVPFYWSDLEPEPGRTRFAADSIPIYRRPPPDKVVEFCLRNRLTMKGHPLVWHQYFPQWRPDSPQELMSRINQRIQEIAARYGNSIQRWEVVNEPMERDNYAVKWCNLPVDYVYASWQLANRAFPPTAQLLINEATTYSWSKFAGDQSPYYKLIRQLLARGAKVDEIGMQVHFFTEKAWAPLVNGEEFTPAKLFAVLDRYADFGRPLAITEITFPAFEESAEGERIQALVTRNFYRLWFSHPQVTAISWWNLVDKTATKNEDHTNAGLLHRDFSPKQAYTVLDQLINHDWKTSFDARLADEGTVAFRGFHGEYVVTARRGAATVTQTFVLHQGSGNDWTLCLPTAAPQ